MDFEAFKKSTWQAWLAHNFKIVEEIFARVEVAARLYLAHGADWVPNLNHFGPRAKGTCSSLTNTPLKEESQAGALEAVGEPRLRPPWLRRVSMLTNSIFTR